MSELKESIPNLKFTPGPGAELPSPVTDYKFYLAQENVWTFKTKKVIFKSLNLAGFDKVFVEPIAEPTWAKMTDVGRAMKNRGDFWIVEHIPDASDQYNNGNISLFNELRLDLTERYYDIHDYEVREGIQAEIGKDDVFDQKHVPKPEYEEQVLKILGELVTKSIQDEFSKHPESWKRVVEYHKQL